MEVQITEYSTFNYLNQQCRVLFQKFTYFTMVEKFSPFHDIRRFTTLDYFLSQLNPIHKLLLLILIWGVQTNAQPTHIIYIQPPTGTLLHCNWWHRPLCSTQFGAVLCINCWTSTDTGPYSVPLSFRFKKVLFITFPCMPTSPKLLSSHGFSD